MIPLGTAYYPDYFPEQEWPRDLDLMAACGIRCVRILEFAWSWYEPLPGEYRWEAPRRFLDLCGERGLEVCLATPTATPPAWFFTRHPDCRMVDAEGRPCYSHRHAVCWQHAGALETAQRTVEALARALGNHPAVWGWQIDNEPNLAEQVDRCYDFHPACLRAGQNWLRERYGTLEALDEAWFTGFWSQRLDCWEQAWVTHAPRINPSAWLDFCRWRDTAQAEMVRHQARWLRPLIPSGQRIGLNIPETGVAMSTRIGQDYWAQAAAGLDWVGTDLYAASGDEVADERALRYSTDLMRSVTVQAAPGAEFLIAETQAGPHFRLWPSTFAAAPFGPDYLTRCMRVYAEHGARQVWWFLWRPVRGGMEIGMNGATDLAGGPTERTRELARMAREDAPHWQGLIENRARKPRAWIYYNQDTHRFMAFWGGLEEIEASVRGAHAWLSNLGYAVDFWGGRDLTEHLPTAEDAILVLPESALLDIREQEHLIQWVEETAKRKLYLGPHTGLLDRRGHLLEEAQRRIWRHAGVTPGLWVDGPATATPYRILQRDDPKTQVTEWMEIRGVRLPAVVQSPGGMTLYATRWTAAWGRGGGATAIAAASRPQSGTHPERVTD